MAVSGALLGGILASNATGQTTVGTVVIDSGGNVWYPWNQGQSYTGGTIGICTTNNAIPGGPVQILVNGALPYSAYNLGPGKASNVSAGVVPSRGSTGTVIGTCDAAGSIMVYPTVLGGQAISSSNTFKAGSKSGMFDALYLGVVANDGTDQLANLNSCVATLAAAGGGELYLPPGTIIVSNTWTISASNVTIRGSAAGQTTIQAQAGADFIYTVLFSGGSYVGLRDLTIDANKANRHGLTNATKGYQFTSCTDVFVENVTVMNTRGTASSSGVGGVFALCTRAVAVGCKALNCGDVGFLSDGFYNNGSYIILTGCIADTCLDTGFVFENASYSGGTNLRSNGCDGGLAIGVAGNSNITSVFFGDVIISNAQFPIEFGLFGPSTNTGLLEGASFDNIIVDCPSSLGPAFLSYPNGFTNAGNTTFAGRIKDVSLNNFQVRALGANQQGIYVSYTDGFRVHGGYLNVDAAAFQSVLNGASSNITGVLLDGLVCNFGNDATYGIQFYSVTDGTVRDCTINGGTALQWGVYAFSGSTNISTPRNRITGGALTDEGGVGGDSGVQPRQVVDGPIYRAAVPVAAGTGVWPAGQRILYSGAQLLEDSTHPEGWLVTTSGLPGTAVFTPFYREGRSINNGGAIPAGVLQYINANGLGNYIGLGLNPDPTLGTDRIAVAWGSAGNVGYIDMNGTGTMTISSLVATEFGVNSNASWPGASFTEGFRIRSNGTVCATGFGAWDPSTTAAFVQVNSCTTSTDQFFFRPGGSVPSTPLEGGLSYAGGYLQFTHKIAGSGSATRERVAMGGVTTSSVTPGVIATGGIYESSDIAITNMNAGDLVKVAPPSSFETGLLWCWIPGGAAGTVRLRIFNVNNATVASTGAVARTWTFVVEH